MMLKNETPKRGHPLGSRTMRNGIKAIEILLNWTWKIGLVR